LNKNRKQPSTTPCPRCLRLISIQANECIHCGLKNPRFYLAIPLLKNLARGEISFIKGIIMVCFGLYIVSIAFNFGLREMASNPLAILSPNFDSLQRLGMGGRIPLINGGWWTLLTAVFLHGNFLHIFFNMWWLRDLGPQVEREYGPSRFLVIYIIAGIAGSILSALAGTSFFVGASGAIFGLFGALVYYGWHRGGTFGSAIYRRTLFWAGLLFLFGLVSPNVDNWGHLGGFIGGFMMSLIMRYEERLRQTLGHHLAALLAMALLAVCFSLMLVNFFVIS
jgi:rhomboid protease GluP